MRGEGYKIDPVITTAGINPTSAGSSGTSQAGCAAGLDSCPMQLDEEAEMAGIETGKSENCRAGEAAGSSALSAPAITHLLDDQGPRRGTVCIQDACEHKDRIKDYKRARKHAWRSHSRT